jgi:hypothetical protein
MSKLNIEVSDEDLMEANGAGMDAYDEGRSIHDNPYIISILREAWNEGWYTGQRNSAE